MAANIHEIRAKKTSIILQAYQPKVWPAVLLRVTCCDGSAERYHLRSSAGYRPCLRPNGLSFVPKMLQYFLRTNVAIKDSCYGQHPLQIRNRIATNNKRDNQ